MAKRLYYQALARAEKVGVNAQKLPQSGPKLVSPPKQISAFRFGPEELTKFANGFYVYLWKRGDEVLYVGSTKNVSCRIAMHHAVGVKEPFGAQDSIEVQVYGSASEMLATELALIRKFRPKHNIAHVMEPKAKPEPRPKKKYSRGPTAKTLWLASCIARSRELREGERARA